MAKNNANFSVAMSEETGCIVMTRSNGKKVTVIGSLTRELSLDFAAALINWAEVVPREAPAPAPRLPYAH